MNLVMSFLIPIGSQQEVLVTARPPTYGAVACLRCVRASSSLLFYTVEQISVVEGQFERRRGVRGRSSNQFE
jgi:hypothetical protein